MTYRETQSRTILVVDDEPRIAEAVTMNLELEGYQVSCASNGQEALRKATEELPDLIILDVMMPYMSGYEVCERIKAEPMLNGSYVIMLTAKGQEIDRQRGEEVGADEYITKPFDPDYLIERAETILGISL